jgi:hypothetical protein
MPPSSLPLQRAFEPMRSANVPRARRRSRCSRTPSKLASLPRRGVRTMEQSSCVHTKTQSSRTSVRRTLLKRQQACLTVKLRGRTTTPDERRGRTLSPGARGAKPLTHHGPLQRLLGISPGPPTVPTEADRTKSVGGSHVGTDYPNRTSWPARRASTSRPRSC